MKQVFLILIVSMLMATVAIASNVSASGKLEEPVLGQTYSIYNTTAPTWSFVYLYAERGDNVTFNASWINGTIAPAVWVWGATNPGWYLNASNETLFATEYNLTAGNLNYWVILSTDGIMTFRFNVQIGTTLNYIINRINHTVLPDDHSQLQAQIDALNGTVSQLNTTMKDLNTTMGSLWAIINATRGNVTTLEGEYAALAERYADILKNLTVLQSMIDALYIPDGANLTEINASITNLMGYYTFLLENISALENITVENVTKVIYNNETINTTVYAYDNGMLKELDSNVTRIIGDLNNLTLDHQKTINDVRGLNGKVTDLENRTDTEQPTKMTEENNVWRLINLGFLIVVCIILIGVGYELGRQRKRMKGWETQQEAAINPEEQSDIAIEEEELQDYQTENAETNGRDVEIIPKVEAKEVRRRKR